MTPLKLLLVGALLAKQSGHARRNECQKSWKEWAESDRILEDDGSGNGKIWLTGIKRILF
jgi:hypothetical protein